VTEGGKQRRKDIRSKAAENFEPILWTRFSRAGFQFAYGTISEKKRETID
jgi:hypothetical protein